MSFHQQSIFAQHFTHLDQLVEVRTRYTDRLGLDLVCDEHGRHWLRKTAIDSLTEGYDEDQVLAEMISNWLGKQMGVPQPDGAVSEGSPPAWCSRHLDHISHWSGSRSDLVVNQDGLGAILALDAIVHNADRHAANLVVQPWPDAASLWVFAIDNAQALVGRARGFADLAPAVVPPAERLARPIDVAPLRDGAMAAAARAEAIAEPDVTAVVVEACRYVGEPASKTLSEALLLRLRRAPSLVAKYLNSIEVRA